METRNYAFLKITSSISVKIDYSAHVYFISTNNHMQAIIYTNKGPIRLNLHAEKTPYTVANFVTLAQNWYYDNLTFHRVIDDFMIQGWCPDGTGAGWPWYQFDDEFNEELRHDGPGVLSMANSGPSTNGSQFFITHVETPWLDGKHTVFWRVVDADDQEVVNNIRMNDVIERIEIEGDYDTLKQATKEFTDQIEEIVAYVAAMKAGKIEWGCCGGHCHNHGHSEDSETCGDECADDACCSTDKSKKEWGCCGGGCGCGH